ncbi:MAG: BC1872 family protein [Bdellovibrio sp.]
MKVGRELDILIAEKVMGKDISLEGPIPLHFRLPNYSTDISAAWEVVEKMKSFKQWGAFRIKFDEFRKKWSVGWEWRDHGSSSVDHEANSESAPYAICLAALKAVNYPIQDCE